MINITLSLVLFDLILEFCQQFLYDKKNFIVKNFGDQQEVFTGFVCFDSECLTEIHISQCLDKGRYCELIQTGLHSIVELIWVIDIERLPGLFVLIWDVCQHDYISNKKDENFESNQALLYNFNFVLVIYDNGSLVLFFWVINRKCSPALFVLIQNVLPKFIS